MKARDGQSRATDDVSISHDKEETIRQTGIKFINGNYTLFLMIH